MDLKHRQMTHFTEQQPSKDLRYFLVLYFVVSNTNVTHASCHDGYYLTENSVCQKCPEHCPFCDSSELCLSCDSGFWGNVCDKHCSKCKPGTSCEKTNGFCLVGCKDGYSGILCDSNCDEKCSSCNRTNTNICSKCALGRYPPFSCEKRCSSSCLNKTCNEEGFCVLGCEKGFWGQMCEWRCPVNCKYGTCYQKNATCKFECNDYYSGQYCDNVSRREETCTLVISICVAVSMVLLVAFAFVVVRRQRVSSCLQNQSRQSPEGEGEELLDKNINAHASGAHRIQNIPMNEAPAKHEKASKQEKLLDVAESYKGKKEKDYVFEWNKIPEQWYKLCAECLSKKPLGKFEQNGIGPYEYNKVKVKYRNGKSYYFNASYIEGKEDTKKTHIACIGPTTEYGECFNVFWRMIWQEKCHTIVMLNTIETETKEKYWPDVKKSKVYNHISVNFIEEIEIKNYTVRSFKLKEDSEERCVKQFQYKAWPERKAADNIGDLLEFVKKVHEETTQDSGPIVVHGRAGVGRTGTFIAIDILWKAIVEVLGSKDEVDEMQINIKACVENLRKQRVMMVETIEQYKFIHQAFAGNISKLLKERA